MSGVGGGSVNAAILASFAHGQEDQAAEKMVQVWEASGKTSLWHNWLPGGVAEGMTFKGGCYNNAASLDFLKANLQGVQPNKRWIDIGVTDAIEGRYVEMLSDHLTGDNLFQTLFTGFSQPFYFEPVKWNGSEYFSGEVVWNLDLFSVVNNCKKAGFPEDHIVVDVLMTTMSKLEHVDTRNFKSWQMIRRYLDISSHYSMMDGLLRAKYGFPHVSFRHVITP